jgi:hypothetical protein
MSRWIPTLVHIETFTEDIHLSLIIYTIYNIYI